VGALFLALLLALGIALFDAQLIAAHAGHAQAGVLLGGVGVDGISTAGAGKALHGESRACGQE
jgi:hypothetical protein